MVSAFLLHVHDILCRLGICSRVKGYHEMPHSKLNGSFKIKYKKILVLVNVENTFY